MSAWALAGLGGSLRERSYSRAALSEVLRLAAERGADVELLDLRALDLPLYVPDLPLAGYGPAGAAGIGRLLETVRRASALVWASPTYHGTVSGAFKNALDCLEFLGDDEPAYLAGKPVGLVAVSDPQTFSAMAGAVHELRGWLAPSWLTFSKSDFTDDLTLQPGRALRRAERLVEELLEFAARRAAPVLIP
jgi:FMN reductase